MNDAFAIVRIEDLMDICDDSHSGLKGFLLCAGLIGIGLCVRSVMKRVDKLEERCRELEALCDISKEDNYDYEEDLE